MLELIARRGLLALSLILGTFLTYLLFINSDLVPVSQSAATAGIEQADAKIAEFEFTQSKGDVVQWQVQAKYARLFEQEKRALLNDVDVTLYGLKGKELTVSGDEGTLDTSTKRS